MLFLSIVGFGIGWRYASKTARKSVARVVRDNLITILLAVLAVAVAVVFSSNTTMRLL